MNYYPNNSYYPNYSYQQPQQMQQTIAALQGKVVDSIDMVRVNEVPFGGFGVFPKGDLSEVYIKSWNSNGTTQINTYRPVPMEETKEMQIDNSTAELLEKINTLNTKIDALINNAVGQSMKPVEPAAAKEVKVNAY